ncbi:MAG: hypothetical protein QHH14_04800, partial [Clostridiales bacterium]|nr:hypothetical protein [Clostridiales bacterium]
HNQIKTKQDILISLLSSQGFLLFELIHPANADSAFIRVSFFWCAGKISLQPPISARPIVKNDKS